MDKINLNYRRIVLYTLIYIIGITTLQAQQMTFDRYGNYGKYYGNYGRYGMYADSHYGQKDDNSVKK